MLWRMRAEQMAAFEAHARREQAARTAEDLRLRHPERAQRPAPEALVDEVAAWMVEAGERGLGQLPHAQLYAECCLLFGPDFARRAGERVVSDVLSTSRMAPEARIALIRRRLGE